MFKEIDTLTLSEIDQQIISYVLNNLEKVSYMRVRDLALAVHVSPSTIMRFVERTGYETFSNFKYAVKKELEHRESLNDTVSHFSVSELLIFDENFESQLDTFVHKISTAKIVYCAGLGSSGIMADYFNRQISSLGYTVVSSKDGYLPFLWNPNLFNEQNLLVVFSSSGETQEILKMMKLMTGSKPFIISITNHRDNTLASLSDMNIPYFINDDHLMYHVTMTSQIPVMFIIESVARKLHKIRVESNTDPLSR